MGVPNSVSSTPNQDFNPPPLEDTQQREDLSEQREPSALETTLDPAACPQQLRHSTHTRKSIEHFKFDKNQHNLKSTDPSKIEK